MKTSIWRRWWQSVGRNSQACRHAHGARPRRGLRLGQLEDRMLLSAPQMVLDIAPSQTVAVGSAVYFVGGANRSTDLWRSDGTTAGTTMLTDASSGGPIYLNNLTNVNGKLFFIGYDSTHGDQLWKSDGTVAGTVMVSDVDPAYTPVFVPRDLTNVNGELFFHANDGTHGEEL